MVRHAPADRLRFQRHNSQPAANLGVAGRRRSTLDNRLNLLDRFKGDSLLDPDWL